MRSRNPRYKTAFSNSSVFKSSKTSKPNRASKVKNIKSDMAKGLSSNNGLYRASQLLKTVEDLSSTEAGRYCIQLISNGISSAMNNSRSRLPSFSNTSTLVSRVGQDETKTHSINFKVGQPSTKSLREAESQHGSIYLQLSNTISDSLDEGSRKFLKRNFGFNSKSYDFLNEKFYVTMNDYDQLYNIKGWKIPEHSLQVPYALVKSEYTRLKIMNCNTYHRMRVKIHLIKLLDDDQTMHTLYRGTFNDSPETQQRGAIPKIYQISPDNQSKIIPNKFMNSVLAYSGTTLNMSSYFKRQAKIVKTFSKTLNPGDRLDFSMTHEAGPGLRIDIAQGYIDNSGKGLQPSAYGIVVETQGVDCQLNKFIDNSIYQGTSPGWYSFESTKGVTVVRNSTIVSSPQQLNSALQNRYSIKVHERRFLESKPLYIPPELIGQPGENGKSFSVVSTSIENIVYEKPIDGDETETTYSQQELDEEYDEYDEE